MDETPTSPADEHAAALEEHAAALEEHAAALKALCAAFYCMNDLLESRGCLPPGELARNLRRLKAPSEALMPYLASIAANLEARNFRPSDRTRPVLLALDGGKAEVAPPDEPQGAPLSAEPLPR